MGYHDFDVSLIAFRRGFSSRIGWDVVVFGYVEVWRCVDAGTVGKRRYLVVRGWVVGLEGERNGRWMCLSI